MTIFLSRQVVVVVVERANLLDKNNKVAKLFNDSTKLDRAVMVYEAPKATN